MFQNSFLFQEKAPRLQIDDLVVGDVIEKYPGGLDDIPSDMYPNLAKTIAEALKPIGNER